MKSIVLVILSASILLLSNCNPECETTPSCIQPNINELTQLRIDLSRFSDDEVSATRLVRIDHFSNEVIDTLALNTVDQFDDEIIIGENSTIIFNREEDNIQEFADLDFKVLIGTPVQMFDITDIRILIRSVECSCPLYLLESLRLNGSLREINDVSYSIVLEN